MDNENDDNANNLPWLLYNNFFKLLYESENGKNLFVKCKLCVGNSKALSTSKNSPSNLKKHITVSLHFIFAFIIYYYLLIIN